MGAMMTVLELIRARDNKAWKEFEEAFVPEDGDEIESMSQIPWPGGPQGNPFAFPPFDKVNEAYMKKMLRTLQLRWHPDKFRIKHQKMWVETKGSSETFEDVM